MATLSPATIGILIVIPLILWRLYARFRRLVGRQRLSRVRPWITVVLFPLLVLMIAWVSLFHVERLAWLGGGLVLGAFIAVYGLRLTKFEVTPEGFFYTPSAHFGIAITLLMVSRVAYRFYEIATMGPVIARNNQDFVRSPLTLVIFGVLAGYYITYAIGLIRWRNSAAPPDSNSGSQ
jgi:hypothetical protein